MKKHLIAAAVAAAVTVPATAQVTVYGVIDMGYARETKPVANTFTAGQDLIDSGINGSRASGASGAFVTGGTSGLSSSRLGFRGEEDLGGGMKAGFTIETGLNQGNGAFVLGGTNRAANVHVSGGFGRVVVGRQNTAAKSFNDSYSAAAGGASLEQGMVAFEAVRGEELGLTATVAMKAITDRTSNGISYSLPTIQGFTLSGSYATVRHDPDSLTDGDISTKATALTLNFVNGPLSLGVSTSKGQQQGALSVTAISTTLNTGTYSSAATQAEQSLTQIGAKYSFGDFTVFALQNNGKVDPATAADLSLDVSGLDIGLTFKTGAYTFLANYGQGRVEEGGVGGAAISKVNLKGQQFQVHYALSKRTTAYGMYGLTEADRKVAAGLDGRTNVSMVGLRHSF